MSSRLDRRVVPNLARTRACRGFIAVSNAPRADHSRGGSARAQSVRTRPISFCRLPTGQTWLRSSAPLPGVRAGTCDQVVHDQMKIVVKRYGAPRRSPAGCGGGRIRFLLRLRNRRPVSQITHKGTPGSVIVRSSVVSHRQRGTRRRLTHATKASVVSTLPPNEQQIWTCRPFLGVLNLKRSWLTRSFTRRMRQLARRFRGTERSSDASSTHSTRPWTTS